MGICGRYVYRQLTTVVTELMCKQLEGCWDPIDRGALDESEDMLSERAIELGVGKYVKMSDGNLEFSIIAMCSRPEDE